MGIVSLLQAIQMELHARKYMQRLRDLDNLCVQTINSINCQ